MEINHSTFQKSESILKTIRLCEQNISFLWKRKSSDFPIQKILPVMYEVSDVKNTVDKLI